MNEEKLNEAKSFAITQKVIMVCRIVPLQLIMNIIFAHISLAHATLFESSPSKPDLLPYLTILSTQIELFHQSVTSHD